MKLAFPIKNSIQFSLHLLFMWGWPMHFLWERALKLNWYRKVLSLNSAGLGYFLHYWHLWSSLLCCHVFTNSFKFSLSSALSITLKFCLKFSLLSSISSVFIRTCIRAYKIPPIFSHLLLKNLIFPGYCFCRVQIRENWAPANSVSKMHFYIHSQLRASGPPLLAPAPRGLDISK